MNEAGRWIWQKACNALGVSILNEDLCVPEACAAIQAFLSGGSLVQGVPGAIAVCICNLAGLDFARIVTCQWVANVFAFHAAMTHGMGCRGDSASLVQGAQVSTRNHVPFALKGLSYACPGMRAQVV